MEAIGAFLDEEWESLSRMFSCEDSDFPLHFDGSNLFSNHCEIPSTFLAAGENVAGVDGSLFFPSDTLDTNFYCVSQESSNSSEIEITSRADENHLQAANGVSFLPDVTTNTFESIDFCFPVDSKNDSLMVPVFPDDVMEEILQLKEEMWNEQLGNAGIQTAETVDSCREMQLKRKYETPGIHAQGKGHALQSSEDNSSQSPKKKPRVSRDAQKNKKNTQSKKNKKAIQISNDEEVNNTGGNGQSSSTCSSEEEDSNASQDLNGGSTSESKGSASNGKAKAPRGPATDPQSLYARKRRERINERLRILQNLVPNGTKVDISTMLEEAVQYVKFLQLQIKLLSSDDLWMYAPIAYNGMDIGLYQKIVPNLWP
ncbi:hypothetical protein Pfo_016820 [Paulownia fortunei]|nr:hypothetical protein Pfo_016820 [Paulownia fortunei]